MKNSNNLKNIIYLTGNCADVHVMLTPQTTEPATTCNMIPSLPAAFFSQPYRPLGLPFNTYSAMLCNWSAITSMHEAQQKALQTMDAEPRGDNNNAGMF